MKKRIISRCFLLIFILTLLSQSVITSSASQTDNKSNTIESLNALLVGVRYLSEPKTDNVANWSNDTICDTIYGKLLWDEGLYTNPSYTSKVNLKFRQDDSDYWYFDLQSIQKITQDTLGREFPHNSNYEYIFISGNELAIMPASGESTTLAIQDYTKQGNKITAVGTAVYNYNAFSEFGGYFEAVFEEKASSIYGYTLLSLSKIQDNQTFDKIEANASSVLKEKTVTHHAKNIHDGKLNTAWVEGVSGVGENEWIKLQTTDDSKMYISAIEFAMGYQKSDNHLKKNGWPHKILIECEGGYSQTVEFYDYTDIIVLSRPVASNWVKITILEAAAGTKYNDTCISEIAFYGIDINEYFDNSIYSSNQDESIISSNELGIINEYELNQNATLSTGFQLDKQAIITLIISIVVAIIIAVIIIQIVTKKEKRRN